MNEQNFHFWHGNCNIGFLLLSCKRKGWRDMYFKGITLFAISSLIASCGGGGGDGTTPTAIAPAPQVTLTSSDSELLVGNSVTLTWSSSNTTACSASGNWSGSKGSSGTESISVDSAILFNYALECTGAGGTTVSSVSVLGYQEVQGVAVDGYIRSADIFIDKNNNFEVDGDETVTVSDNDGAFVLRYSDGNLISLGGYDLDTGNLLDNLVLINKLTGYAEFAAITPITTLASFMETPDDINRLLGIDASIDISRTDPVAVMGDGGVFDYLYEKGNQVTILVLVIQNIANDLNLTTDTSQDYFKAFAEEVDAQFADTGEQVDIETSAFITTVVDNIVVAKALSFSEENRANVIALLSAVIPVIEVKEDSVINVALFNFATSTLQADVQALANGTASTEILNSYAVDVLTYIATDQNISSDDLTPNNVASVFTSGAAFFAAENQMSIGAVTATDPDGDAISFTVSGSEFVITSGGALSFVSAPDYETQWQAPSFLET